jgi:hypothetical protein
VLCITSKASKKGKNWAFSRLARGKKEEVGDLASPKEGFSSSSPRGAEEGGQRPATQHGMRAATRESASIPAPGQPQTRSHQQARPHQQQKLQQKGLSRQDSNTQQHIQSGYKRTRSRKDPGATACKGCEQPQGQRSQHAAVGAPVRQRWHHNAKDPRNQATNQ